MENMYWIFEYAKVFTAYVFLMFIWPFVVFRRQLRGKSLTFQVCFCPTCSIVLINTVILFLGLFHILNRWVVCLFFYGIFVYCLLRLIPFDKKHISTLHRLLNREYGLKMFISRMRRSFKVAFVRFSRKTWRILKPHLIEYLLLFIMILYGMIYFSWGAFQDHSYGFGDMYVHHSWIYNLTLGKIFSSGVYPEAMHCFIYTMHTLFGIQIYNCNLFLEGIHMIVYIISAYCMLKEVFRCRGSILIALALFLIIRMDCIDGVFSMSRLQWTLPQEFGLFTQFLCAAFLVRFLKSNHHARRGRKTTRRVWDENLLVFALALSASISIHFYTTIMAFFLCLGFAAFSLKKVFRKTHFLPLVTAAVLGVVISVIPMAGALASGIPFQGSIGWALNIIAGTDTKEGRGQNNTTQTATPAPDSGSTGSQTSGSPQGGTSPDSQTPSGTESTGDGLTGDASPENTAPRENIVNKVLRILKQAGNKLTRGVLANGYYTLYPKQGKIYVLLTITSVIMLAAYKCIVLFVKKYVPDFELDSRSLDGHAPILLASYLFLFLYAAPLIGLPELVAGSRLSSTIHLLLMTVAVMPLDLLFSILSAYIATSLMQTVSVFVLTAICFLVVKTGYYHGYLYFELTRYNGVVDLTRQIIEMYPENTYTIVSPTDELYQVIQYGRHTDLFEFMNHTKFDTEYYIPTEYIFFFVEKKPLQYAQSHFFQGPAWLAQEIYPALYTSFVSQCPDINCSEISAESAAEIYHTSKVWPIYTHLENRIILESRAFFWCQDFARLYTYETEVYHEDDDFVCYRVHQNPQRLFNLVID